MEGGPGTLGALSGYECSERAQPGCPEGATVLAGGPAGAGCPGYEWEWERELPQGPGLSRCVRLKNWVSSLIKRFLNVWGSLSTA